MSLFSMSCTIGLLNQKTNPIERRLIQIVRAGRFLLLFLEARVVARDALCALHSYRSRVVT